VTNEQKNQVAAMNASGMSVDEITIDTGLDKQTVADFVAERNAKKKGRGHPISEQTKQAIVEWYQSGHPVSQTAKKFGVDPKTVKNALGLLPKEKEPAAAATATDSKENIVQVQNTTGSVESQALRGVNVLGILECALSDAYGTDAEIMSLKADSDTASIMFRYGGKAYSVQFGLAF
jgi:transposase-like protein